MVLRICALLALGLALAAAQAMTSSGDGDLIAMANEVSEAQYNASSAEVVRERHFYCLGFNQSRINFPFDDYDANGQLQTPYNWAIFLQYPVLSYLDSLRKALLIDVILRIAQAGDGAGDRLESLTTDDFCIARVFHNRVADYEESVLINFYFRGNIVQNPDNRGNDDAVTIRDFNTYFQNGLRANPMYMGRPLIRQFRERDALAIEAVIGDLMTLSMTEMNAHPFGNTEEGDNFDPDDDPTLRAVVIASNAGYVDVLNITYRNSSFATNPRPINYGLEAGDYVFIVFGTFFLAVVSGLTVLGFCIHPFFLA